MINKPDDEDRYVLLYKKHDEHYVIVYDESKSVAAKRCLVNWVTEPALDFAWKDAVKMTFAIMQKEKDDRTNDPRDSRLP